MLDLIITIALAALSLNLAYEFFMLIKDSKKVRFWLFRSKNCSNNEIIKQDLTIDINQYAHILLPIPALIIIYLLFINEYNPLNLGALLIVTIIVGVVSHAVKVSNHKKIIRNSLPDAIDNFCNTISASNDVYRALDYAATNAPYPLNNVLADITNSYVLEHDIASVIIKITREVKIIELTFFCVLLQTYLRIGGDAITPLINFAKNLKESIQFSKKLASAFSSSISQSTFLFLFPFLLLVLYYFIKPDLILGVYNNELTFMILLFLLGINLICLFYMHFSLKKKTIC